jgi:serine/threonine protein kinase
MAYSSSYGFAMQGDTDILPLSSRFTIHQELQSNSNRRSFLAEDNSLTPATLVELTILPSATKSNLSEFLFFLLEIQSAAKLSHPHIIRSGNPEQLEGIHFFVREHRAKGLSLQTRLTRQGWFSVQQTIDIAKQIAEALHYAHQCEVLHLSLEPNAVLLDQSGNVTLTGFGVPATGGREWAMKKRTESCPCIYLSPEQLTGETGDQRSDLYMLGILLYEMLTDLLPFNATDKEQLVQKIALRSATPPHLFRSDVPEALSIIISKLLASNPDLRYQEASALSADLNHIFDTVSLEESVTDKDTPHKEEPFFEDAEPFANLIKELEDSNPNSIELETPQPKLNTDEIDEHPIAPVQKISDEPETRRESSKTISIPFPRKSLRQQSYNIARHLGESSLPYGIGIAVLAFLFALGAIFGLGILTFKTLFSKSSTETAIQTQSESIQANLGDSQNTGLVGASALASMVTLAPLQGQHKTSAVTDTSQQQSKSDSPEGDVKAISRTTSTVSRVGTPSRLRSRKGFVRNTKKRGFRHTAYSFKSHRRGKR